MVHQHHVVQHRCSSNCGILGKRATFHLSSSYPKVIHQQQFSTCQSNLASVVFTEVFGLKGWKCYFVLPYIFQEIIKHQPNQVHCKTIRVKVIKSNLRKEIVNKNSRNGIDQIMFILCFSSDNKVLSDYHISIYYDILKVITSTFIKETIQDIVALIYSAVKLLIMLLTLYGNSFVRIVKYRIILIVRMMTFVLLFLSKSNIRYIEIILKYV